MSPSCTARDRAAGDRLGRDVAGHEAAGGAGEAAVGDAARPPRPGPARRAPPVTASISRMPGPPAGPSLRMTTTSPALIPPAGDRRHRVLLALEDARRALWWTRSWPESFTTQPSGARLPRRIARPPVFLTGSSTGRTTSWPAVSSASRACSPIVWPVTVCASSCRRPASSRRLATTRDAARLVEVLGHEAAAGLEVARHRRGARRCGRSRRCRARRRPRGRARAGAGRRWSSRRWWRWRRSRSPAPRG